MYTHWKGSYKVMSDMFKLISRCRLFVTPENAHDLRRPIRTRYIVSLLVFLLASFTVQAQDAVPPSPQAAFLPYQCTFDTQTNSAQIRAVLMGSNGQPVPSDSYTVQ